MISGFVFNDVNDNCIKDPGEAGIAGVTITLTGKDIFDKQVSVTVTTGADGSYTFNNVDPGVYFVTETQPAGWIDGCEQVGSGVDGKLDGNDRFKIIIDDCDVKACNFNFGEKKQPPPPEPNSISGYVFCDTNNNGVKDAGEEGIAGVLIDITGILEDGRDWGVAATTTDASGFYQFTGLLPGTYTISESQPAGYTDGKDLAGTPFPATVSNDSFKVRVRASDANIAGTNYNFGEIGPSSISGSVYLDANYNGQLDAGDSGLAGVQIFLNGTDFQGNAVDLSTTTDANGDYRFENLLPGVYNLLEVQPNGLINGRTRAGSSGGVESGNAITQIVLDACTDATGYFFGEAKCPDCPEEQLNTLSGFVYQDCDFDGIRDANEEGIAGVRVVLTGTDNSGAAVSRTTTTDASGKYTFTDLKAGTYRVDETQPAAFLDGKEQVGTPFGGVATGVGADSISNIVIPESKLAQHGVEYNFGEVNNSISGFVYEDTDDDGIKDAGEAGIAGVTVTLTGTDDLGAAVSIVTTTAADGSYSFTNLRPGTYKINETQPPNYDDGKDTVGDAGGTNSANDELSAIQLLGCTHGKGYNFGERTRPNLHSISGFVFNDCPNNDGNRDANEVGIAGVTIVLTGTNDLGVSVSATTTTNADGFYEFKGLRAGTYRIVETQPANFIDGKDKSGTPFAADATVNDVFSNVVIPPSQTSQNGVNYNFGELEPASISGFVFLEKDGTPNYTNRGAANGDLPLANVTVTLTGTNDQGVSVSVSTITNSAGFYEFKGLRPGTYTLRETQPSDPGIVDDQDFAGTIKGGTVGTVGNDIISNITLPACADGQEYNFGEKLQGVRADVPNSISGFVYHDLNRNGIKDPNEPGIPCVRVVLTGTSTADAPNGGPVNRTVSTSATGFYQFLNVFAGTYTLTQTQPIAYQDFRESIGTPFSANLPAADNDTIINIQVPQLPGGLNGVNYNFGEVREISKRDFIVQPPPQDCGDGIDRGVAGFIVTPQISDFTPITMAFVAVGSPAGAAPLVRVFDAVNNQDLFPPFLAYNPDYRGGVRVATADMNGDGYKDIITTPGPGGEPTVAIYSGLSGALLKTFLAYDPKFQNGLFVTTGDVNGDGQTDIITAPEAGGGPHVRVFDGKTFAEIRGFMAYDTSYTGGVTVAAGDVDGDGKAEVITAPATGATTTNKVQVVSVTSAGTKLVSSFSIPDALAGVNVAVGDLDNDGKVEILAGPTNNASSKVRVFRGTDGMEISSFNAFDTTFAGGIRLAAADLDGDGDDDIIASAVTNNTARIRILSGLNGTLARELTTAVVSSSANVYLAGGSAFGVV